MFPIKLHIRQTKHTKGKIFFDFFPCLSVGKISVLVLVGGACKSSNEIWLSNVVISSDSTKVISGFAFVSSLLLEIISGLVLFSVGSAF